MSVGLNEFCLVQICTYQRDPWADEERPQKHLAAALAAVQDAIKREDNQAWPSAKGAAAVTTEVRAFAKRLLCLRTIRFSQTVEPETLAALFDALHPLWGEARFHLPTAEHGTISRWTTTFAVGRCAADLAEHFAKTAIHVLSKSQDGDSEALWHPVRLVAIEPDQGRHVIWSNHHSDRLLVFGDEPVQPIVAALAEDEYCCAEGHWQNASAHRQEFVEGVQQRLVEAYQSLKLVTRELLSDGGEVPGQSLANAATFGRVYDTIAELHFTRHALEDCRERLQSAVERLSSAPLKAIMTARCRALAGAAADARRSAELYPSLATPAIENAKWAAQQREIKASERVSKNLLVLQIILVLAAIWPQTAATFIDKETGDIPVWATSMRAFFLVMFVPFLVMCFAAYFVVRPAFERYVSGPVLHLLGRLGSVLKRPRGPMGSE